MNVSLMLDRNPHGEWGTAILYDSDGKGHPFDWHQPSGEILNADPDWLIRCKGIGIANVTPIVSLIRMIYHCAMTILNIFLIKPLQLLARSITPKQAGEDIKHSFFDIFRSVYYGGLMTGKAVVAVIDPRERRQYARLELILNRDEETGPWHSKKFYMALCFQPLVKNRDLGNLDNSRSTEAEAAERIALDTLQSHMAWRKKHCLEHTHKENIIEATV